MLNTMVAKTDDQHAKFSSYTILYFNHAVLLSWDQREGSQTGVEEQMNQSKN